MNKKFIKNVRAVIQRGVIIYVAHVPARELVPMCQVDHYDSGGVQRKINDSHVIHIAEAMSDKNTIWLDPVFGSLVGNWKFKEDMLVGDSDAMISLDDGQHRWKALGSGLLDDEEIAELQFEIKVTQGLDRDARLRIFRAQAERRRIDRRLDLAQRHELDEWPSSTHKHAYDVILALNTDPTSPIKGRVQLLDTPRRGYHRCGGRDVMLPSSGLHSSLVIVFGRKSPLHSLDQRIQKRVIMDMIRISSQVWSSAWDSDKHILTTARGINALLRLCISGSAFRSVVGIDFLPEKIEEAFRYARRFRWAASNWQNRPTKVVSDSLNQCIESGLSRAMRNASRPHTP